MISKLMIIFFLASLTGINLNKSFIKQGCLFSSLPDEYANVEEFVYFLEKDKFGFMDNTGKTVIPPKFIIAHNFLEGLASVSVDGKSYGYIDKTGAFIIQPKFFNADDFSEGVAFVSIKQAGKKTLYLVNKSGQTVSMPDSKYHGKFSEGLCRIETKEGKCGYIDKTGKYAIQPIYNNASDFHEGLANVTLDKLSGFIDNTGKMIIEPQFTTIGFMNFSGGFTAGRFKKNRENGLYQIGFINTKGELQDTRWLQKLDETVPYSIYAISNPSEGLSLLSTSTSENFWAIIDMKGNMIMDFKKFDLLYDFQNGMAAFSELNEEHNGKWGFINNQGAIAIKAQFNSIGGFMKNGLAWVEVAIDKKVYEGYINKKGEIIKKWFVRNE